MTEYQIRLMKHCIGLDKHKPYRRHGKQFYRPCRNYFDAGQADLGDWKAIEASGYAVDWNKRINRGATSQGCGWFKLTEKGMRFLGNVLGVCIYEDEAVRVDG